MINDEEKIFISLNEKLKKMNQQLELICGGGFVLSHYGIRATQDIDSFYQSNAQIEEAIKEVGEEFKINPNGELWLNNSIQNLNQKPPRNICEVVYEFSNLKVLFPPLEYIICMKLYAGREQDVKDVAKLIKFNNITNPQEIDNYANRLKIGQIDESILLESFGEAYGMEWLERYYIEKMLNNDNKYFETSYNNASDIKRETENNGLDYGKMAEEALGHLVKDEDDIDTDLIDSKDDY